MLTLFKYDYLIILKLLEIWYYGINKG